MLGEELSGDLLSEEVAEMGYGIEHGYSIAIGALTYLFLLRRGCLNIVEFATQHPELLPAMSDAEVDRVRLVRSGRAAISSDNPDIEFIDDSSDLAHAQTGQYFFDSPDMEYFLEREISSYQSDNRQHQLLEEYCEGVRLGFSHAIGMYVQCFEERALPK